MARWAYLQDGFINTIVLLVDFCQNLVSECRWGHVGPMANDIRSSPRMSIIANIILVHVVHEGYRRDRKRQTTSLSTEEVDDENQPKKSQHDPNGQPRI